MSKEEVESLEFYDTQAFNQELNNERENSQFGKSDKQKQNFGAELVATKINKKGKVIRILKIKKKK